MLACRAINVRPTSTAMGRADRVRNDDTSRVYRWHELNVESRLDGARIKGTRRVGISYATTAFNCDHERFDALVVRALFANLARRERLEELVVLYTPGDSSLNCTDYAHISAL